MPTVRRQTERQVEQTPLRGGRMTAHETPQSEGAGVEFARADKFLALAHAGERLAQFGGGIYARLVEAEHEAADNTALLKANNRIAEWKNDALYNPERGALTKRGEAALPIPEELKVSYDKVAGEIAATLTTPRQQAAFEKLRAQEWQGVDLTARRHVFTEIQEYRAKELTAAVDNSVNAAVQSAQDPRLVAVELQKAVSAIRTNAPSLGLGPEQIDARVRAVQTKTHVGVISQLLAKDQDQAAQAYFDATKTEIEGEQYDNILKALEEGTLRGQGQREADLILAAGGTLTEQREKARAITDPKLRDEVTRRLEHEATVKDREDRERKEETMRAAYDILDRTADVSKIPPDVWTSFDGGTRSAMLSYAKTKAKGVEVETDLPTYYQLMFGAGHDPQAFAQENLLRFRHKLGETEFKQLAHMQLAIKQGDQRAADKDLAPFQTRQDLVDNTLTLHGIDPRSKPDTAEGKAIAQLRRMVDLRVELLQAGGKKAGNADIQAEVDRLLSVKETVPGSWWNIFPGGAAFRDTEKRLIDLTIADVPAPARAQIEAALKARNRPVSDATVLDLYLETRLRGRQ